MRLNTGAKMPIIAYGTFKLMKAGLVRYDAGKEKGWKPIQCACIAWHRALVCHVSSGRETHLRRVLP